MLGTRKVGGEDLEHGRWVFLFLLLTPVNVILDHVWSLKNVLEKLTCKDLVVGGRSVFGRAGQTHHSLSVRFNQCLSTRFGGVCLPYLILDWTQPLFNLFLEMNLTALLRGLADLILDFDHFQLVLGQSWTWTILENQSVRWVNIYLQIYPDPWSFLVLKNLDEYHTWPLINVTMLALTESLIFSLGQLQSISICSFVGICFYIILHRKS